MQQASPEGARCAVLFCHGFMGSARQFDFLLPVVERCGWIAEAITLPGHGSDIAGFAAANEREWQATVDARIDAMRQTCDALVLVGHSMGGLLLVNSAVRDPSKIAGVLAIALPLRIRLTWRAAAERLKLLRPERDGEDERIACLRQMGGVSGLTAMNSVRTLPNTIGLLRVMRGTRRALPSLNVPLILLQSGGDEIVSPASERVARKLLPATESVPLPESGHVWYSPADRAQTERMLLTVLERWSPPTNL